jgi:hypothetical protein
MSDSVFFEIEFILLVLFSLILPISIYAFMMWKKAISRKTVLLLGLVMIVTAGVDVFLLQQLKWLAQSSFSMIDDFFFVSELSVALYLLPALFAGIGINMVSHVLMHHLVDAELRFDREHPERRKRITLKDRAVSRRRQRQVAVGVTLSSRRPLRPMGKPIYYGRATGI